ncbi:MAG: hypothetical protein KDB22_03000 [Planctomycetales bacterium]|nr:hypothetical protein [Planctomycetales bacterium]
MHSLATNLAIAGTILITTTQLLAEDLHLFPVQTKVLQVPEGNYVLCPSRQFIDKAISSGTEKTSFIFYAARLLSTTEDTCQVRSLAGSEFTVPNELVIPIAASAEAAARPGDILLTWWQSGSGMQRAIVVGGTATRPVVRYLDVDYENPSGIGKRDESLESGTFHVLQRAWQPGSSVAIKAGSTRSVGQLIWADENAIIVREFAGKLKLYARADATPIAIRPELKVNAAAMAQLFGTLKPVTVSKVDARIGRVFCTYQLGRTEKEKAFPFGEIDSITNLVPLADGE